MLVEVGKFTFLVDFVILQIEEDIKVPLILGRTFFHTTDAEEVVLKVDDVSLVDGVFDGAFGGDGEEDFVMVEGVVVSSSSLDSKEDDYEDDEDGEDEDYEVVDERSKA
nr:reverse transcriptase domain-containing protein [Tanacetum cinerariifolium]